MTDPRHQAAVHLGNLVMGAFQKDSTRVYQEYQHYLSSFHQIENYQQYLREHDLLTLELPKFDLMKHSDVYINEKLVPAATKLRQALLN